MSASTKGCAGLDTDGAKQVHDYVRHIMTTLVSWFTVFITVNYATLGWLLSKVVGEGGGGEGSTRKLRLLVAILFIVQNGLGLFAIGAARKYLLRAAGLLTGRADALQVRLVPQEVYPRAASLMQIALGTVIVAWLGMIFLQWL